MSARSEVERLRAAVEGKSTPTAWSEGKAQRGGTLVAGAPRPDGRSAPIPVARPADRKNARALVVALGAVLGVLLFVGGGLVIRSRRAPAAIPSSAPVATETPPDPPPPPATPPTDPTDSTQLPPVSPLATSSVAPNAAPPLPPPVTPPLHPTGKPPAPPPPPPIASVASAAPSTTTAPTTAPVGSVHGRKIRTDL